MNVMGMLRQRLATGRCNAGICAPTVFTVCEFYRGNPKIMKPLVPRD
jgi:hypothetical protein